MNIQTKKQNSKRFLDSGTKATFICSLQKPEGFPHPQLYFSCFMHYFERISTRGRYYTLFFWAFWDICTGLTSSSQAVLLWREQEFNQLRSQLLDYGFPDYESNKELYKELGISKEALELYKTWNFNDRKYGDPFLKTIPGRSVKTADVLLLCNIFAFVDIFRKEESKSTTLDSTGLAAGNAAHQVIHKQWQKMEYKIHTKM